MIRDRWDMRAQTLLLWLSRKDWSLRGECDGPALDLLIEQGLAEQLFKGRTDAQDGICLTAMGWAAVARTQERQRMNEVPAGNGDRP